MISEEEETLAWKLRKAREKAGLTQEKSAKVLGLDSTAITKIEHGDRSVSAMELLALAKAYHVPVSVLLDEDLLEEKHVKRVHENLKQLTFTKTEDRYHPLHVRIQTPDKVDIGLWLDRWQTVDVVSWLQSLVSVESMVDISDHIPQ